MRLQSVYTVSIFINRLDVHRRGGLLSFLLWTGTAVPGFPHTRRGTPEMDLVKDWVKNLLVSEEYFVPRFEIILQLS